MTSRTTDFRCNNCGKYMFSEYTYGKGAEYDEKLDKKATRDCGCRKAKKPTKGKKK